MIGYSQEVSTKSDWAISTQVEIKQIPSIMQAMGFYPSDQEIEDMKNEVKYSRFTGLEGMEASHVDFDDLIKCKRFYSRSILVYFNHRPACGLLKEDIEAAFTNSRKLTSSDISALSKTSVLKADLSALLLQYGKL